MAVGDVARRGYGGGIAFVVTRGFGPLTAVVVPPLPAVLIPVSEYTILLRDARTLSLLGEMPRYIAASWTRRAVEMGDFRLDVHADTIDGALIVRNTIVEIRRDGVYEFAGIIRSRIFNAASRVWTLTGNDLKWFLGGRQVNPGGSEFDTQSAVAAETAMKHYVAAHLTAPSDSTRGINPELSGITFTVEGDTALGASVTFNARFINLLTGCLIPLATAGDLLHDVVFQPDYAGYTYTVDAPVDATVSSGAVPWVLSSGWDTVSELVYYEDYLTLVNAIYVLGQGAGAARAVREVKDTASITADFRREASIDSRNNATNAALDQDGNTVIDQSQAGALRLDAQPLTVGPSVYRSAWDLGYTVSVGLPTEGISVDRRIVEVNVQLSQGDGETIKVALGSSARTMARAVSEGLRKTNRVAVA